MVKVDAYLKMGTATQVSGETVMQQERVVLTTQMDEDIKEML